MAADLPIRWPRRTIHRVRLSHLPDAVNRRVSCELAISRRLVRERRDLSLVEILGALESETGHLGERHIVKLDGLTLIAPGVESVHVRHSDFEELGSLCEYVMSVWRPRDNRAPALAA